MHDRRTTGRVQTHTERGSPIYAGTSTTDVSFVPEVALVHLSPVSSKFVVVPSCLYVVSDDGVMRFDLGPRAKSRQPRSKWTDAASIIAQFAAPFFEQPRLVDCAFNRRDAGPTGIALDLHVCFYGAAADMPYLRMYLGTALLSGGGSILLRRTAVSNIIVALFAGFRRVSRIGH